MSRRKMTFDNLKFFTKKTLRKYVKSKSVLFEKNQQQLTRKNVNDDENSFRRNTDQKFGLVSTQQIPLDNSNFANNTFFGSAEVKVNVAFEKIINKYPFDAPFDQVERFEDRLSSFEKYIFDRFPKSRGFLRFDSSQKQYITVKDKSGFLSQNLLKGNPGKQYINPEDKSFSIEMCLRLPEDSKLNQNSYLFHCISQTASKASGFAAFVEGFDFGSAVIAINDISAIPGKTLTIRDTLRTVNFTPNGGATTPGRTDANNYTFGTSGVSSAAIAAVRLNDAIDLALSNGDLLVTGSVAGSDINLTQRRRGDLVSTNIDGTMTTGSPKAMVSSGFSGFNKDIGSSKIKFIVVSGSNNYVSASHTIKKGEWYNLNFVYDKRNSQQFLAINSGSLRLATSDFFEYSTLNTAGSDLHIGYGPSNLQMPGSGKLLFENNSTFTGSMDEFRLFHNVRNKGDIDFYSRRDIFAHDNLRLLYSFNEPTGSHANNDIVLDRSGHSLHSRINNFTTEIRNPDGIKNPMFLQNPAFNPVLFPTHEDVINLNSTLLELATDYDMNNPNKITKLVPKHYFLEGFADSGISEDGEIVENYAAGTNLPGSGRLGSAQLMNMMLYFMAEQLDSYKMYLDQASELIFPDYKGESGVADAFLPDLAAYYGFELPNIFGDVSQEQFSGAENLGSEFSTYEKSLSEIQSMIWRRVLKNLSHIMETKGTKDSIRSLFRSSGIEPDRLFRMVEYHNKNEFRLGDSRQSITEMSTLLNFSGSVTPIGQVGKGDGTFANKPTLLSAPLSGSRIEPGFPEVSGGSTLCSATISMHPTDPNQLPRNNTIIIVSDAYKTTHGFKFVNDTDVEGLTAPNQASVEITVAQGHQSLDLDDLGFLTLRSWDMLTRNYVFVQGEEAVATGTILAVGSKAGSRIIGADTNAAALTKDRQYRIKSIGGTTNWAALGVSGSPSVGDIFKATDAEATGTNHGIVEEAVVGGVAVKIPHVSPKKVDTLLELRQAILHANGHNGRIVVGAAPDPNGVGLQSITLKQSVFGNFIGQVIMNSGDPEAGAGDFLPSVSGATFSGGRYTLVSRRNSSVLLLQSSQPNQLRSVVVGNYIEINTGSGEVKRYEIATGTTTGTLIAANRVAVNIANINSVSEIALLNEFAVAISSVAGHSGLVSTKVSNVSGAPTAFLEVRTTDTRKFILHSKLQTGSGHLPVLIYQDKTVPELIENYASVITGSFGNNLSVSTKRSAATSNIDTIKLRTKDFSRLRINTSNIHIDGFGSNGTLSNNPFLKSTSFSGGSGFVKAGVQGFENNGVSVTHKDGLFTSGSWSLDGVYEFPSNLPRGMQRSLSRIVATGDSANVKWKDKHVVLSNLVLSENGDTLSLFCRPVSDDGAPIFSMHLTGANFLNGQKWYIAYGRQRNDQVSLENESMYFIKAASYNHDKVDVFLEAQSIFDETLKANGDRISVNSNIFQNHKVAANNSYSAPRILIGQHNFFSLAPDNDQSFLNSINNTQPSGGSPNLIVVPTNAKTSYFDGKVGHLKFWSKALTSAESLEHARNFKSVGTDNPLVNNTFSIARSGSFEKLRLNISTDQINKFTDNKGIINFIDFSQTFTKEKFDNGISPHASGAIGYGFETSHQVIHNERFDYTILSPFYDEFIADERIKIAGFSEGKNIKTFNSKVAPVTEILPFEREIMDNRFEIQINLQRALNEDIMNIFSSLDALDNALGQPNLQFSREYVDLKHLRNLYFDRLTDKVNYRNFFDLFRWVDDAFSGMIERLVPRNVDFMGINLIIESHALERYKVAYGHHEIYKGEDERGNLRSVLLVSQRSGVIRRF